MSHKVVMVRTGENVASMEKKFCGWLDVPLSVKGQEEAKAAGKFLREDGTHFSSVHTSLLTRATNTLDIILEHINQHRINIDKDWRLNERQLGELTGMRIYDAAMKYGQEQVLSWQYSYDSTPPEMDSNHRYYSSVIEDIRYKDTLGENVPKSESLETTFKRVLPYWDSVIVPQLRQNKTLLIICHGDVLRGLVKFLDRHTDEQIEEIDFLAGVPIVYDLDSDFNPCKPMEFISAKEIMLKAMASFHRKNKIIYK